MLDTKSTTLTQSCDVINSLKLIWGRGWTITESKTGSDVFLTSTKSHYCCLDNCTYFRICAHCPRSCLQTFRYFILQVLYSERMRSVFSSIELTVFMPFYSAMCRGSWLSGGTSQVPEAPPGGLSPQSSVWTHSGDSGYGSCPTSSLPSWTLLLNFCPIFQTWIVSLPSIFMLTKYSDYPLGFMLQILSLGAPCSVIYNWGSPVI